MSESQPATTPEFAATRSFSTVHEHAAVLTESMVVPDAPGYQIVRLLGRGGMGIVYEARDLSLQRTVALKMILLGPHASEKDRERFRQEAEAVARLQHPGIVQIYEIGESSTGPFLALEFVAGGSLAERLDGKPWLAASAARLIEQVAEAVETAHVAGIVHRDLKPANILLSAGSGQWALNSSGAEEKSTDSRLTSSRKIPESERAFAKITDFGLAKRLDSDQGQTASGAIMGTPSYMSPEQAEGKNKSIGPATDVYALGAILYELLTGRPPFVAETPFDTIMQVSRQEPVPPSRLNAKVPRDLVTICLMCLRKEPDRRYPTAAALAEDLRRFRQGHPILARPVGPFERGWRWCRRNPIVAILLTAVAVLLISGTCIATYFAVEANDQWRDARNNENAAKKNEAAAQEAKKRAESTLYAAHINLAQNALRDNRLMRLRELLRETAEEHRGWEWHFLQRQAAMHVSSEQIALPSEQIEHSCCLHFASFRNVTRSASIIVPEDSGVLGAKGAIECQVREYPAGRILFAKRLPREKYFERTACQLSGDGKHLAVWVDHRLTVFDVESGTARRVFALDDKTFSFTLDLQGDLLACNELGKIVIRRVDTGVEVHSIAAPSAASIVQEMRFARNGVLYINRIDQTARTYMVQAYDVAAKKVKFTAGPYRAGDTAPPFALRHDGNVLALPSGSHTLAIWDTVRMRLLATLPMFTDKIESLALMDQGRHVAVGISNGLISIHDFVDEGATPFVLRGHEAPIWAMSLFGPAQFASIAADGMLLKWNFRRLDVRRFAGRASPADASVFEPVFDRTGTSLVQIVTTSDGILGMNRRALCVWDTATGAIRLRRDLGQVPASSDPTFLPRGKLALSPDGRLVAFVHFRQEDLDALRKAAGLVPGILFRFGAAPGGSAAVPRAVIDASFRALLPKSDVVQIFDIEKKEMVAEFPLGGELVNELSFSSDGSLLLIDGDRWRMYDVKAKGHVANWTAERDGAPRVAFHPPGDRVAIAHSWKLLRGEVGLVTGPIPSVRSTARIELKPLDPKLPTVAVPLTDAEKKLHIARVLFSPGGRYLAAVGVEPVRVRGASMKIELPMHLIVWRFESDGTVVRHSSNPFGTMMPFMLTHPMVIAFDAKETMIAAGALAGLDAAEVRVWDMETGTQSHSLRVQAGGVELLAFTPDGRRLITAGGARSGSDTSTAEAHIWELNTGEELLEIPLGSILSGSASRTSVYHFDGYKLRAAGWNHLGGELRELDGTPTTLAGR